MGKSGGYILVEKTRFCSYVMIRLSNNNSMLRFLSSKLQANLFEKVRALNNFQTIVHPQEIYTRQNTDCKAGKYIIMCSTYYIRCFR